jgi:hypothetical protein
MDQETGRTSAPTFTELALDMDTRHDLGHEAVRIAMVSPDQSLTRCAAGHETAPRTANPHLAVMDRHRAIGLEAETHSPPSTDRIVITITTS